jgi:hypothetical protein
VSGPSADDSDLRASAVDRREVVGGRLDVEFVDGDGVRRVEALLACWSEPFERARPVRGFTFRRDQRSYAGWWWSCTTDRLVGYESWVERDHAMLFDFDRDVVGFASQPFWLSWTGEGGPRRHAPDYFVRRCDGTGLVVDVRPDDRVEARDQEAFDVTRAACAAVGWSFVRLGEPAAVLAANVRWLSRYRHARCAGSAETVRSLLDVFAEPRPLLRGADQVGDRIGVLPVLYHLMWRQVLVAELGGRPLNAATAVKVAEAL